MRGIDNFIEGKLGSVGSKSRASNTPPRVSGLEINNKNKKSQVRIFGLMIMLIILISFSLTVVALNETNENISQIESFQTHDFQTDFTDNSSAVQYVNGCGTLSTANAIYYQNESITNNTLETDCIIISAQNIIFDCQGYFITSEDNYT